MILTDQNYHSPEANRLYMSASQFKAFQKCHAAALAELKGDWQREESTSLLVGSYVDAHFSRTLDVYRAHHPEIFKRDGGLKSEFVQAETIIARVERDETFMSYLAGDRQVIMTGIIGGVMFKIKPDFLHPERIVDLKIMRDFESLWSPEESCRLPWVEFWGYDIQGAIYQEVIRQNTGARLPFILAAATKQPVPDIGLFSIPQSRLDYCLDLVEHLAPEYSAIKIGFTTADRCEKCDYCRTTKVLTGPVDYDAFAV